MRHAGQHTDGAQPVFTLRALAHALRGDSLHRRPRTRKHGPDGGEAR